VVGAPSGHRCLIDDDDVDLHGWFRRDELSTCPACGQREALAVAAASALLCLACGRVSNVDASDTTQKREPGAD
jgi:hypothetical protein